MKATAVQGAHETRWLPVRGSRARQHWPGKVDSSTWKPAGMVVYSCSVELPESQKSWT